MVNFNIFNFIFVLFIFSWTLYAFFILYHFIRFGVGRQPKILSFWFLIGCFLLLIIMSITFFNVNWNNVINNIKNV